MHNRSVTILRMSLAIVILAGSVVAQEKSSASSEAEEALQKAVQNPVASLISVPLQNNTGFDIGTFDRTQNVLNI